MNGWNTRLVVAVLIIIILLSGIVILINNKSNNNTSSVSPKHNETAPPATCRAGWAHNRTVIVSGLDLGNVYYTIPKGEGKVLVYKTLLQFLTAESILPANSSLSGLKTLLSENSTLAKIASLAGNTSIVTKTVVSPTEGYEILLPEGKTPDCIKPGLKALYPKDYLKLKLEFAGYSRIPYPSPNWSYYNQSLPAWYVIGPNGKTFSTIWVDPQLGVIVAEKDPYTLHIWALIAIHVGG